MLARFKCRSTDVPIATTHPRSEQPLPIDSLRNNNAVAKEFRLLLESQYSNQVGPPHT